MVVKQSSARKPRGKAFADVIKGKRITAVGIRYDNREFKTGAKVPRSNVWIDNVRTAKKLPGTSAVGLGQGIDEDGLIDTPHDWVPLAQVEMIARGANRYGWFTHAYVIAGEDAGYGEDDKEVLIRDAVVIARLW